MQTVHLDLSVVCSGLDGFVVTAGSRILLMGQQNPIENGVYVLNNQVYFTRTTDMPLGARATTSVVRVSGSGDAYMCTNAPDADVVGTNALQWSPYVANTVAAIQGVVTKAYVDGLDVDATLLNGLTNLQHHVTLGSSLVNGVDHMEKSMPLNQLKSTHAPRDLTLVACRRHALHSEWVDGMG
jgi:hypothetical protein